MAVHTTEVAIIGAGVHGASVAFHLATLGVKPVVLDRGAPAGGTTGRSSAICRAYYTNAFLADVAHDSMQVFEHFDTVTGGRDAGFRKSGMLYLHGEADALTLRSTVTMLNRIGTAVDLLDRERLAREFPQFTLDRIAAGAFERDAGYADPVSTTTGLLQRALELGGTSRFYCKVSSIKPRARGGADLATSDGSRLECERLLIAAGPWTKPLVAQCGVDLPLSVERHYVATFAWADAAPIPFGHADIVGEYYVRPEGRELFLAGPLAPEPTVDPDHYSQAIAPGEVAEMTARITARVPSLHAAGSTGGWASLYDVSPDWQPVIGEIAPGIVVDAGTSGHGFKLAPALGRHVAALLMGRSIDDRIAQFSPVRFHAGAALAAGYGNARILG